MKKLSAFWNDETGATAIEYALVAMFISLTIVASSIAIGATLFDTFGDVAAAFPR